MRILREPAPSRKVSVLRSDLAVWANQVDVAAQLLGGAAGEALHELASQIARQEAESKGASLANRGVPLI